MRKNQKRAITILASAMMLSMACIPAFAAEEQLVEDEAVVMEIPDQTESESTEETQLSKEERNEIHQKRLEARDAKIAAAKEKREARLQQKAEKISQATAKREAKKQS